MVFHAGTAIQRKEDEEALVTSGGRVMAVVGMASGIEDAQKTAYDSIKRITFEGIQYRKDIASRACKYSDLCTHQWILILDMIYLCVMCINKGLLTCSVLC